MTTTYTARDNGQPSEAFRTWLTDHGIDPKITTEVHIGTDMLSAVQVDVDEHGNAKADGDQAESEGE